MNEQGKTFSALLATRIAKPVFLAPSILFSSIVSHQAVLLEVGFAWCSCVRKWLHCTWFSRDRRLCWWSGLYGLRLRNTERDIISCSHSYILPGVPPDGNGIAGRWHLILGYYRFALKPRHQWLSGRTKSMLGPCQSQGNPHFCLGRPPWVVVMPEPNTVTYGFPDSLLKGLILWDVEECQREAEHEMGNPE